MNHESPWMGWTGRLVARMMSSWKKNGRRADQETSPSRQERELGLLVAALLACWMGRGGFLVCYSCLLLPQQVSNCVWGSVQGLSSAIEMVNHQIQLNCWKKTKWRGRFISERCLVWRGMTMNLWRSTTGHLCATHCPLPNSVGSLEYTKYIHLAIVFLIWAGTFFLLSVHPSFALNGFRFCFMAPLSHF